MERHEAPVIADERTTITAWLVFHRATLRVKCEGLTDDQLRTRAVPPSTMSLLGLVRHCADVERAWWRRTVERQPDLPPLFWSDEHPDGDFDLVDDADVAEAFAAWDAECAHGDEVLATKDLDDLGNRQGVDISVRWVVTHLIEEYARHNGHADLIRECLDGVTGE